MKYKNTKRVFSGRVVDVETGIALLPNGHKLEMEKIIHPGGAAVVVLNHQDELCFLKQYRCVIDEWLIELPAGKIDGGESPVETAKRELQEETGIIARQWDSLGYMISSPGVFTERVHLFLARDIAEQGDISSMDDEVYELGWVALDEAFNWVMEGTITDAKTAIAICKARQFIHEASIP